MSRTLFRPLLPAALFCVAAWLPARAQLFAAEGPNDGDPGLALHNPPLSADEEKTVRAWFTELGSEEFDIRDAAVSKIVGKGLAVLPIAKEFFNDPDREIAMLAKSLRSKILLKFDGFLPADPALLDALAKAPDLTAKWHFDKTGSLTPLLTLRDICIKNGVKLEIDTSSINPEFSLPTNNGQMPSLADYARSMPMATQGELLQLLASFCQARGVARGDVFLITSADNAQRLARQRYTFDWSALELSRDEAARAEKELAFFFPSSDTEIHSGSTALLVSGPDASIVRAARLIALMKPRSPDAIWPAPAPADDSALLDKLSTAAAVQISTENPIQAASVLNKQKFDVNFHFQGKFGWLDPNDPHFLEAWSPGSNGWDMATLNLNFNQRPTPLGLILRWCERRAKVTHMRQPAALAFDVLAEDRIVLQARDALFPPAQPVCGAEVAFLYKAPAEFSAETDAAVLKQILDAFDSHLALYPALDVPARVRVFRGRLIAQGPSATLRHVLALLAAWRASGAPPAPAAWRAEMEAALNATLEWDGRGLTGGKLLSLLRKNGKVSIFLEDSATSAANFELSQKDAELFEPGRYTLKALLDELASRAKAQWKVELGAIVLTPK